MRVRDRLRLLVSRGRVERTDAVSVPRSAQMTLLEGEVADRVPLAQQFGFTSRPRPGSEAVVVSAGGVRSDPVAVATLDPAHPGPELAEGEAAVFAIGGALVHLRADGSLMIVGDVELVGDLAVTGSVRAAGDVADGAGTLSGLRNVYNIHTHVENDSVTNPPLPPAGGENTSTLMARNAGEGGGGGTVTTSDTAPENPQPGDFWVQS